MVEYSDEDVDIDFSNNRTYDYSQMAESFLRFRGSRFYDQDSFTEELEKHFSPELVKKASTEMWANTQVQNQLKVNRKELKDSGKLPKGDIPRKRVDILEKKRWRTTRIKGHSTKAYRTTVTINKRKVTRYRDSFGRFTSSPSTP